MFQQNRIIFHQRGSEKVIASSLIGEPSHDIPILVKNIKEGITN